MSGRGRDYRSYLLRLYRVRKEEGSHWRASLQSPPGGKRAHFASLGALVAFLEQEGELEEGPDEGEAEEDPETRRRRGLFRWLGLSVVALGFVFVPRRN